MCGIAGIVLFHGKAGHHVLKPMADALQHRGPEEEGFWYNEDESVGLAHRRLSIIDLSDAGRQPMQYLHYTISFNGEIYNYKELKLELQQRGYNFYTDTDTEVIPAAFDNWGLDCLHHFDGMFAFALHNNKTNVTLIARDRFGEKPLYYTSHSSHLQNTFNVMHHRHANGIVFASEMKALWAAGVDRSIDHNMMLGYLAFGFVQNPNDKKKTFYKNISSLAPGHAIQVNRDDRKITIFKWYDPKESISKNSTVEKDEKKLLEKFSELLCTSISRRLRSDVAIGSSLSGGIDSSSLVAITHKLLQRHHGSKFSNECFTAIFPGFMNDESEFAQSVAGAFHLNQHTTEPTANDLADHWKALMYHQEEPVQSGSVFTQYMVYKLAKENNITVLLDGQGADEILGGYKKYSHWYLQQLLRSDPVTFLKEKKLLKKHHFLEQWNVKNYIAAVSPSFTASRLTTKTKKELHKNVFVNSEYLRAFTDDTIYEKPVIGKVDDLLFYNTFQFGLEELLRYADRNSMAHSREVRLPFLNHELVEFVFSLPSHFKIRDGFTKWILRESVRELLPGSVVWRINKIGYEPPQKQWMQMPALQSMVMDARQQLVNEKILNISIMDEPVEYKSAHAAFNYDWRYLNAATIVESV